MSHDSAKRQRELYSRSARLYDLSTALAGLIYRFSDKDERRKAARLLDLEPGVRVLEVGVGTGANLPLLAEARGDATLVGLDLTRAMLRVCRGKLDKERISAHLLEGDATHLPFRSRAFDAVLIFGAFNGLDDRKSALREVMRVAKPGAKIVIADEGMSERKRATFLGKLFCRQDPWLTTAAPLELLPQGAHLDHFRAENWYLIDFTNGVTDEAPTR
jgi:ubiquinone/menaquinone biosynthesis C-methylase UbiE